MTLEKEKITETSLIENPLDLIEKKEDRAILIEISHFLTDFSQPITSIQVNKLVLNDIEYPTEYAKVKQAKLELMSRYYNIVDSYYDIKKKELELELLDEEIEKEEHSIKKKLKQLEKEKNTIQLQSIKSRLEVIMKEIKIYHTHYKQYNGKYNNLTDENKSTLEEEMWEKKALNNPVVFEERYGNFIKEVLGNDKYKTYLEHRKISIGLFPRELIPTLQNNSSEQNDV